MPLKLNKPREGHPNYVIRGTYLGTEVRQTSGTPDRRVALKELARVQQEIESRRFRTSSQALDFMTAAISYLDGGGDRRFVDKLTEHFGETPVDEITQASLDAAAVMLYPEATASTRNRQVYTPVSAILGRAGIDTEFRRPRGAAGKPRTCWLNPDQANALTDAAWDIKPRFGALLAFLFASGCRLSEALELQAAHLDLTSATAWVGDTKNGEPRMVHLPPALVASLANADLRKEGRVFGLHKAGRIYTWLDQAARNAGVVIPDGVAFHITRHTWATMMRRYGGADTRTLVATGAWRSRQAAAVYEHSDPREEAKRADLIPLRVAGAKSAR